MAELHPPNRRRTAKQRVVLEALGENDNFRSAQQLHLEIIQQGSLRMGLASVYRILRTLVDDRIAETQRAEDGEILYRLRTSPGHRHYLMCRRCGRAVGFTPTELEKHTRRLGDLHGYTDLSHHIDLFGICSGCRTASTDTGTDPDA